ncbi:fimbria/pilus periplasmic chaperone [Yersinia enterocolitica]|uniref:fimbria/pilus periplasmic chaperone n=1 Tax=Yersinia enterocolitica TaxID=630 RepID=UPI0021E7BB20|nr:fimbria/pilus periplasmic chaperone [Yersinia enterocolitica]EKN3945525.1 fimbria/pilus periplasmic chaperone [Yersinia enterocolitica]EKN3978321.1 fimbria/pilus periplasmic chaperone [Yersinia enterocolitica]EKN3983855.1 fimbria/pilus periplasmic chaperone [Yersinia enterocolitica]EKN5940803.1 molecular chaperone [Yersinia enterocolitica]EKN6221694.1 molecular chaperone [Yersinia enterocolitica]
MKININKVIILIFSSLMFLPYVYAKETGLHAIQHKFSVKVGETRAIYPLSSVKGISLSMVNPQDYPILVQTQIKDEDKHSSAPFVVTPPLFRLDAGMQGRVRVIRTGGNFPQDRESLQWLCLTGVPPKEGDIWDNGHHDNKKETQDVNLDVRLSISTCMKLLVRPDQLKQKPEDVAGELIWQRNGKQLQVNNPTPFYISFKSINLGGKNINLSSAGENTYVAPFGERSYALPMDMAGSPVELNWKIINDLGGESQVFKANV